MIVSLFPLFSAIIFLSFALCVLYSDTRKSIKYIFSLLCLSTFWWQFSWFFLFTSTADYWGEHLAVFGHIGILFLPVLLFHLAVNISREKSQHYKYMLYAGYISTLLLEVLLFTTPYIINGVHHYSWGMYPRAGILHPLFIAFVIIYMAISTHMLYVKYIKSNSLVFRARIKYLFLAIFCYNLAAVDFITNYGFNIYPFGFIFIILFIIFTWQGISQHYLLKISSMIKPTVSYICLFTFALLLHQLIDHASFLENKNHQDSILIALGVLCAIAVYEYINTLIQKTLDNYTNPKRLTVKVHEDFNDCTDTSGLLLSCGQLLSSVFPVDHACALHTADGIKIVVGDHSSKKHPLNTEKLEETISRLSTHNTEILTPENIKYYALPHGEKEQILNILSQSNIGLLAPIKLEEKQIGILVLGEKPYQEKYTPDEVEFLNRILPMFAYRYQELST